MPASVVSLTTSNAVSNPSAGRARTSRRTCSSASGEKNRVASRHARTLSLMSTALPPGEVYDPRFTISTVCLPISIRAARFTPQLLP
jgi:hypothetical protein